MSLSIDIRDPRLDKGRLAIAAGTSSRVERDRRKASLLLLIDSERGRAIIDRLRRREINIEQVHDAVQRLDLASLEPERDPSAPDPVYLGATIDGWLKVLHGLNRAKQTIETYTAIARSLETFFGVVRVGGEVVKDVEIGGISRSEGERWLTEEKASTGAPWAPRTQTTAHSLAAQIWDRAIAQDEERADRDGKPRTITRNFWRREGGRKAVRGSRIKRTRFEFLQRPRAAQLLRANKGTRLAAWVAVGIYAGLRGGEAANLRVVEDLDLSRGTIKVQPREGRYAWRTKTENSRRTVPIHPRLARWLSRHIEQGFAGELYLFRHPKEDAPLSRSMWRVWTRTAFERGGVLYGRKEKALTYHSLRHTFASWLTMADVHPLKIARLMGDTVEQVMKTYAHLVQEDLEEAIRRL